MLDWLERVQLLYGSRGECHRAAAAPSQLRVVRPRDVHRRHVFLREGLDGHELQRPARRRRSAQVIRCCARRCSCFRLRQLRLRGPRHLHEWHHMPVHCGLERRGVRGLVVRLPEWRLRGPRPLHNHGVPLPWRMGWRCVRRGLVRCRAGRREVQRPRRMRRARLQLRAWVARRALRQHDVRPLLARRASRSAGVLRSRRLLRERLQLRRCVGRHVLLRLALRHELIARRPNVLRPRRLLYQRVRVRRWLQRPHVQRFTLRRWCLDLGTKRLQRPRPLLHPRLRLPSLMDGQVLLKVAVRRLGHVLWPRDLRAR